MRHILSIVPTLLFVIFTGHVNAADFYYEITNPYAPNAEDFLISQTLSSRRTENYGGGQFITYYSPSIGTGQGQLTYKFGFAELSDAITLSFKIYAANFGSSYGDINVKGSKNGIDYLDIASLPKPAGLYDFMDYNQTIGSDFAGSDEFYLKVEMNVVNNNILSQWLRHDNTAPADTPIFTISVNYVPEPSNMTLAVMATVIFVIGERSRAYRRKSIF
jgi:hypothetical protein